MEDLSTDSEDNSSQEHDGPDVLESSKTVNGLADDADGAGDDEHDSWSNFIDHNATDEGDDDVGEGVEGIKKIELGLTQFGGVVDCVVFADVGLEGLDRERSTDGVSKQYSHPKTTRHAIRRAT